jgi:hypothetical protein
MKLITPLPHDPATCTKRWACPLQQKIQMAPIHFHHLRHLFNLSIAAPVLDNTTTAAPFRSWGRSRGGSNNDRHSSYDAKTTTFCQMATTQAKAKGNKPCHLHTSLSSSSKATRPLTHPTFRSGRTPSRLSRHHPLRCCRRVCSISISGSSPSLHFGTRLARVASKPKTSPKECSVENQRH